MQQKSFSLEEENETGLSAGPLHDQERRGAPTQGGGHGGLPRAGLPPAGELEGKNHRASQRAHILAYVATAAPGSQTLPAQEGSGRRSRRARFEPGDESRPGCEPRVRHAALPGTLGADPAPRSRASGGTATPYRLTAEQPCPRSPAQRGGAQGRGRQHRPRLRRRALGARLAAPPGPMQAALSPAAGREGRERGGAVASSRPGLRASGPGPGQPLRG